MGYRSEPDAICRMIPAAAATIPVTFSSPAADNLARVLVDSMGCLPLSARQRCVWGARPTVVRSRLRRPDDHAGRWQEFARNAPHMTAPTPATPPSAARFTSAVDDGLKLNT